MTVALELRLCEFCGGELPPTSTRARRFCGVRCRVGAHRRRRAADRDQVDELATALGPMGEAALVALVERAAVTQWRAASWLLERRHPARWARRPLGEQAARGIADAASERGR
jgi:hypothetical protein